MKLNPRIPPGRTNRKARAFASEIARLRLDGYGCGAIREALADAGVDVSKSTVQREVARLSRSAPLTTRYASTPPAHQRPGPDSSGPPAPIQHRLADEPRSGKDIAEAFVKGRITNPLMRARS